MIIWHGVPSNDVPVVVEHPPGRKIPRRKMNVISVPGKNGDILIPQDAYENFVQTYSIQIPSKGPRLDIAIRKVTDWLLVSGYQRLEDSYEPDIYRMAYYIGDEDIENILNQGGKATIQFNCRPERWLKKGEQPLILYIAGNVFNPTDRVAKPLITVSGSGSGTLTVAGVTIYMTDCNGVILDCENQDAYKGSANMNGTVSGNFPAIPPGQCSVSWTGGVTGVTIVPRWWML